MDCTSLRRAGDRLPPRKRSMNRICRRAATGGRQGKNLTAKDAAEETGDERECREMVLNNGMKNGDVRWLGRRQYFRHPIPSPGIERGLSSFALPATGHRSIPGIVPFFATGT
jgi:hypothetical protein